MDDGQSATPWRCDVQWNAHTDDKRGPTCRPDNLLHPAAGSEHTESER